MIYQVVNILLGKLYNLNVKTSMLRSDLCDYSDAYMVVKERITVERNNANHREDKKLTFKNNAPFGSCICTICPFDHLICHGQKNI